VDTRGDSIPVISLKGTGDESQDGGPSAGAVIRSSTNVFHAWHDGQRPIHFGEV